MTAFFNQWEEPVGVRFSAGIHFGVCWHSSPNELKRLFECETTEIIFGDDGSQMMAESFMLGLQNSGSHKLADFETRFKMRRDQSLIVEVISATIDNDDDDENEGDVLIPVNKITW